MTLQYNFFFQLRVDQLNETAERAKLFVDVMYLLHSQSWPRIERASIIQRRQ